jgi:hypothetical protein
LVVVVVVEVVVVAATKKLTLRARKQRHRSNSPNRNDALPKWKTNEGNEAKSGQLRGEINHYTGTWERRREEASDAVMGPGQRYIERPRLHVACYWI